MRGSRVLTLFEYLAYTDPHCLIEMHERGWLDLNDWLVPRGWMWAMRRGKYKRINRRIRQVGRA